MKELIAEILNHFLNLKKEEIINLLEIPKDSKLGDFAFPCFFLSKIQKKNPDIIAKEIASKLKNVLEFEKIEPINGYLNIFLNRNILAENVIKRIQKEKNKFGCSDIGKGKTILIDMSSPNIAKPFGIGHLRSTIIGNSIANICSTLGFKTIKINYLGDFGTQFGKLIVAYKKFGNYQKLKKEPIKHLFEIYVKINNLPELEDESRKWFKKLERGNKEAIKLWKLFRALSIKDFNKIYSMLNINFDEISGESLYGKKANNVITLMQKQKLLKKSQGALVIELEKYSLPNVIIKKSDGTKPYITRDIAAAIDRYKKYKFDKMIYEVGSEQNLHFRQLFKILELLGFDWAKNCIHLSHGLYLDKDGKKLSTRQGKTIFMEDILNETIALAKKEIEKREKNIAKKDLNDRAEKIALSAIIYGDLKNYRQNDIVFDIEKFLSFEGSTGPYLLYTYARARNILKKSKSKLNQFKIGEINDLEKNLLLQMNLFPSIIKDSFNSFSPNLIANYALHLAQTFNEFYHSNKVIGSDNESFRLALVDAFSQVLKNALSLLGISVINRM
ncbi:MAG: arginine--tRNA ligase [Candidatus Pacearchaeota archaeon]|nr:arginine--tRNA ligase [Candidatus Pacearchaeota archaeon]